MLEFINLVLLLGNLLMQFVEGGKVEALSKLLLYYKRIVLMVITNLTGLIGEHTTANTQESQQIE